MAAAVTLDTVRVFRVMQAAGIDPTDPAQVDHFTAVMLQIAAGTKPQTRAEWNKVIDQAGDQYAADSGMAELKAKGQANDPTALFELTDIGKGGQQRRQAAEGKSKPKPAGRESFDPADHFKSQTTGLGPAPDPGQWPDHDMGPAHDIGPEHRVDENAGKLPNDPAQLWDLARRQSI